MTVTSRHSTHLLKRWSALALMGVGATLAGLGAAGAAAACTPDFPVPPPSPADAGYGHSAPTPPVPDLPFVAGPPAGFRLGEDVSLNPQPLPPGPERGRRVSLNPQPLPPGPDWELPSLQLPGF